MRLIKKTTLGLVYKALAEGVKSHRKLGSHLERYGFSPLWDCGKGNLIDRCSSYLEEQDWTDSAVVRRLLDALTEVLVGLPGGWDADTREWIPVMLDTLSSEGFEWNGDRFEWSGGRNLTASLNGLIRVQRQSFDPGLPKFKVDQDAALESIQRLVRRGEELLKVCRQRYQVRSVKPSGLLARLDDSVLTSCLSEYSQWISECETTLRRVFTTAAEVDRFLQAPHSVAVYLEYKGDLGDLLRKAHGKKAWLHKLEQSLSSPFGALIAEEIMANPIEANVKPNRNGEDQKPQNRSPSPPAVHTISLTGDNARVNINSHDSSINVVVSTPEEVFTELRRLVQAHIEDATRQAQVLAVVQEMEDTKGTSRFGEVYLRFMSVVADHIQVYQPLVPVFAQWVQAALS